MRRASLPSLFLAALLAGCGGGGSHSDGLSRVTIDWPATRAFTGSPIAGSAHIEFSTPDTHATVAEFTVQRPEGTSETSKTYALPDKISAGTYVLTVLFCAGTDGDMSKSVGLGSVVTTVGTDGKLRGTDGKTLPDVDFVSTLTSISIPDGQSVLVGEKKSLLVNATTASGATVSVPFSAVSLTLAQGTSLRANDDGTVTGLSAGTAQVIAKAFGLQSVPTTVTVTQPTP